MARRLDELRAAVAEIESRVEAVMRGDGFVEDLIKLRKHRNALLAEIRGLEISLEQDLDDTLLPWSRANAARRH